MPTSNSCVTSFIFPSKANLLWVYRFTTPNSIVTTMKLYASNEFYMAQCGYMWGQQQDGC